MSATERSAARHAREAIALAVRTHGRKRGWHVAAQMLGVSERVVRAIQYGEAARPDEAAAMRARLTLAERRLAQLNIEAAEMRGILDAARDNAERDDARRCLDMVR
jgi:cyanate lyase